MKNTGRTALLPGWYFEFQAAILRQSPRPGEIDQVTAEGWTNNQKSLKNKLVECLVPPCNEKKPWPSKKFALLADLGIITVPDDSVPEIQLTTFNKKSRKEFFSYNDDITDKNFPNPTRVLKPGDKLRVRAFKQVVGGTTTSEERMAFLATQKAIHTGAQGASLVFDQKRDQLPRGKWYASFDEPDRLRYADGYHEVPSVICYSDGGFGFGLVRFEGGWRGVDAFLCFWDIEQSLETWTLS